MLTEKPQPDENFRVPLGIIERLCLQVEVPFVRHNLNKWPSLESCLLRRGWIAHTAARHGLTHDFNLSSRDGTE